MPDSITVAAFVVGLVLVIAAFIGKELKVAAVELPALNRGQRVILGALGVFLVVFGLTDGQPFGPGRNPALSATPPPETISALPIGGPASNCFPEVPAADRVLVPISSHRRTELGFGSGQPREATLVIEFSQQEEIIGGLQFKTDAGGSGLEILSVVDSTCVPVTTYSNASRPDQPVDSPYNYDTLNYRFGEIVIAMDVSYGEGDGKLHLRAEQVSP